MVISVGLPVAVNNPVPASQVGFQQFRAIERFCVEAAATNTVIVGTPVMIQNVLLTLLSERHFLIFANLLTLSIFFLATVGEGPHKWISLGPCIS